MFNILNIKLMSLLMFTNEAILNLPSKEPNSIQFSRPLKEPKKFGQRAKFGSRDVVWTALVYSAFTLCYNQWEKGLYNRGVNRAKISGPAREIFFSARPGPARIQCITKFVL